MGLTRWRLEICQLSETWTAGLWPTPVTAAAARGRGISARLQDLTDYAGNLIYKFGKSTVEGK
jgi:hypothetical protein